MNTLSLHDLLLREQLVSPEDMEQALASIEGKDIPLPEFLIQQHKLKEGDYLRIMARHFDLPFRESLEEEQADPELIRKTSIQYLRRNAIIPLNRTNGGLTVAVNNPFAFDAVNDISLLHGGVRVNRVLAPAREIMDAINKAYSQSESAADEIIQDLDQQEDNLLGELDSTISDDLLDEASDAPIIKLVNHVLSRAVKSRASDIHIEPYKSNLLVRFRLDGVLYDILDLSLRLHAPVVSRIKVMAGLTSPRSAARRTAASRSRSATRRSTCASRRSRRPSASGSSFASWKKASSCSSWRKSGLSDENLDPQAAGAHLTRDHPGHRADRQRQDDHALRGSFHINSPDKNILTIEDPIEYQLHGIGQIQVNPKIDLTFAKRAALHRPPGPGRHPGRRDPRPGNGGDRHPGGAHRAPGLLHPAHQRRGQRRDPPDRHGHRALPGLLGRARDHRPAPRAARPRTRT
jgi:general secretion pathway protein E